MLNFVGFESNYESYSICETFLVVHDINKRNWKQMLHDKIKIYQFMKIKILDPKMVTKSKNMNSINGRNEISCLHL